MRAILTVSNWPNPSMILSPVSYEGNIGCIKLTKSLNDFISCFPWGQYWLYQIDQIPQWFYLMFPMRAILAYQINQIPQWFYLMFPMRAILAVSNWPNPSMILPPVSYEGNIDCMYQIDQIPQWFYLLFPMRAILAVSNWPNPSMILPPVSYEGNIDCMYQIDQIPQWFYLLFPMRAILTVSNWPNPSMILPPVSYEGNIDCIKLTKSLNDFISCFLWGQYWLYQIDQIPQWFHLLFPMRAILAVCIKLTKSLNDFTSCFLWGQYWLYQIDQIPLWFYLLFPMRAILTVSNWPNPSMILSHVSYEGNIGCIKLTKSLNDFTSCFLWGQYWLYVSNWPNPSMILPPVSYEGNIDCIKLTKSLYDFTSCFLWGQYWLYQIDQIPLWFYLMFPMRAILAVSNWPNPSMILSHVSYEGNSGCIKLTKSLNDFISCFLWGQYWLYQIDQISQWFYLLFPMRAILTVSNWPNPSMILSHVSYEGNIDCIKLTKSLNEFISCFLWGQ